MTPEQKERLIKISRWCAYQERCEKETREKMRALGAESVETEEVMALLRDQNYLNEQRFARSYARGKFRTLKWGRIKIASGLHSLGVADSLIKAALKTEFTADEYAAAGRKLIASRRKGQKADTKENNLKIMRFMQQRGFEAGLVREWMKG
jgi:regulatory protein